MRPGARRPMLAPAPAEHRRVLRRARRSRWSTTRRNRDPRFLRNRVRDELLPLLDDVGPPRPRAGPVLARPTCSATTTTCSTSWPRRSTRPTPERSRRRRCRWPVGRCGAGSPLTHPTAYRPDAAAVERVLDVAAGRGQRLRDRRRTASRRDPGNDLTAHPAQPSAADRAGNLALRCSRPMDGTADAAAAAREVGARASPPATSPGS